MGVNATVADPTEGPDLGRDSLISGFRAGDEGVFSQIVRAHRESLYAVARRYLGNHADADEATQQAFVKAWKGRETFRGDSALRTWLIRIVINVAHGIRSTHRPQQPLEQAGEPAAPGEGPQAGVEAREREARLRAAIETLPPRQRRVVTLKVMSELTHKEVAEAMEISEGAVKAHLHQAISNLRGKLNESS